MSQYNQYAKKLDAAFKAARDEFSTAYANLQKAKQDNDAAQAPVNLFAGGCHLSRLGNQYLADAVYDYFTGKD